MIRAYDAAGNINRDEILVSVNNLDRPVGASDSGFSTELASSRVTALIASDAGVGAQLVSGLSRLVTQAAAGSESGVLSTPSTNFTYVGALVDGEYIQQYFGGTNANDAPYNGAEASPNNWDRFETNYGYSASVAGGTRHNKRLSAVHFGGPGALLPVPSGSGNNNPTLNMDYCRARGAFGNYSIGASVSELNDLRDNTDARGVLKKCIDFALLFKSRNHPIMIRPFWEMNGQWGYPWQVPQITAATYVAAWQRMWHLYNDAPPAGAGCTNVSFFWCPNVLGGSAVDPTPWFPGASFVDWIGLDGYNKNSNQSPATIFNSALTIIQALPGAGSLPVGLGEFGCYAPTIYPGGKSAWLTELLTVYLPSKPQIKFISYFNRRIQEGGGSPNNWQNIPFEMGDSGNTLPYPSASIDLGQESQAAWQNGIALPKYLGGVANGLGAWANGNKVPIPT